MQRNELVDALRQRFESWVFDLDVADSAPNLAILKVRVTEGGTSYLLSVHSRESGEVTEVRFAAVAGNVVEPRGFENALRLNSGGVKGSPYYFSVSSMGGYDYLSLETKTRPTREMTADEVVQLVSEWFSHPLITRKWNFPAGVANFLWED